MKKTSTEEEIDEQLFTFKRLLIAGSNILVILKGGKRGFALENKRIYDDETQIVRKMIEQGLAEEVCVMSDKKSEMQYMLLPKPQKHKRITKSYVFPSKNQWSLCTHLKYWWLKLLRRKPTVCDGVDDQKEIQEVMDNTDESGGVIVLVREGYVLHKSLRNPNVRITGCEQK